MQPSSDVDNVESLINFYIKGNEKITSLQLGLEKARGNSTLSRDDLHKGGHEIRRSAMELTLELVRAIEQLSEAEKIQLMASPEKFYEDIIDPSNLDDVYAREGLFKFILNPSQGVIGAHEKHRDRMISEFKKYSV